MTAEQAVDALLAWVDDTLPDIIGTYDHVPAFKNQSLPDCVCEMLVIESTPESPDFPMNAIEQVHLLIYRCALSFMVDNATPASAAATLRSFADTLGAEVLKDATLGDRVEMASSNFTFDFVPALVQYEDGTRGRELTMNIAVATGVSTE
jgi:hypothetical protein